MSIRVATSIKFATLLAAAAAVMLADSITFENQCPSGQAASGPCSALFSTVGNAETLSIATSIGNVVISGGALFNNIANLPSDETTVYGTAGNASGIGVTTGSGFTNPLTITFPVPVTSFSIDILNGNTTSVEYQLSDNAGNVADFQIAPNFSGGLQSSGFATTGTEVTISALTGQSTPSGMTWDFLIDNIDFTTQSTFQSTAPEPVSALLIGAGLLTLGLARRPRKTRKRVPAKDRNLPHGLLAAFMFGTILLAPIRSAVASPAATAPPPALTLSDNQGDSVTIDATGTATCAGFCATTLSAAGSPGSVTWAGTLGVFNVSVAGGQSKPALLPSQINLELGVTTGAFGAGAGNAVLTAKWSDVGFGGTGTATLTASQSISGSVTVSYTGHVDNTNAFFGTGTTVGTIGPTGSSSNATVAGPGPLSQPFSMTEAVTVSMGANSTFTLAGVNLTAGPPPALTLACSSASGEVGAPYDSHFVASGGYPPYVFSSTGTLPTGLALNPSTGEISGTPAVAGNVSFTAEVMDASGDPTQNTVQSPCSITVTTPPTPLALACPNSNDEELEPYSSSLVATGGTPPYTFTISSGSLPPGLSLNPSTGAVSGIDNTAIGAFPFTAAVVDSSGNVAANKATINCLLVAAAPKYTMVAGPNTTPQTVVVNTAVATPLAVVVTDSKNNPAKGVTVTFYVLIPKNGPNGTFTGGANNEWGR
jgi:large repetitive protein